MVEFEEDADGGVVLSINEKGNRTRYYNDLADADCPMMIWDNATALKWSAFNVAMSHVATHGLGSVEETATAREKASEKS